MIEKLANADWTHEIFPDRKPATETPSVRETGPTAPSPITPSPPPDALEELDRAALALEELASRGLRVALDVDQRGGAIRFEVVDGNGNVAEISSVRLLDLLNTGGAEGLLFDASG